MSGRRVVVTGMGAVCCLGHKVRSIWEKMLRGEGGIAEISNFDASNHDVRIAGEVHDFDPTLWMDRREVRRLDLYAQFAVAAGADAVKDSGLEAENGDPRRMGVVLGVGIGGLWEIERQEKVLQERGPGRVSPFLVPKLMPNAAAGELAIRHGLKGPSYTVASACASATHALGDAFWLIRDGKADVMVSGGSEAAVTPLGLAGFCSLKALSKRNDEPEKASRPFDRNRDGFVLGEGAGIVVLEELEHAKRRGAKIYAEFVGFGMTSDAHHITAPEPGGTGSAKAMTDALADGGIDAEEVDYVNAHGTSTPLNDAMETRAIKLAFGGHAKELAISSSKSMIGHMLGASGGVELAATVLALKHQVIPPTINYEEPDPECDLDYVPNVAREAKLRVAISNSFGFGGHNATVVLRVFEDGS
jgi:3-oxoacyl-[acyl-carrier-protein] synthase II